ncbi:MAG TPA: hypothetical protein ACFYD5_04855, partial [Candidatus Tripitaka sp. YC43]
MSEKSLIIGRAGCGRTTLLLETFCSSIKARAEFGIRNSECGINKSELRTPHSALRTSCSTGVLFLLPTHSQVEHIKDVIIRKGFAPGFIEEG